MNSTTRTGNFTLPTIIFFSRFDPTRLVSVVDGVDRISALRDGSDVLSLGGGSTCNPSELDVFTKPAFLHEYRWWASHPNPKLKAKYEDAAMRPFFIEHAEKVAEEAGLSDLLPAFVENSEKLQALEENLRKQSDLPYRIEDDAAISSTAGA